MTMLLTHGETALREAAQQAVELAAGRGARARASVHHEGIAKIAMRGGMKTLHQDSLLKVKEGLTSIEEAIANVPPDM